MPSWLLSLFNVFISCFFQVLQQSGNNSKIALLALAQISLRRTCGAFWEKVPFWMPLFALATFPFQSMRVSSQCKNIHLHQTASVHSQRNERSKYWSWANFIPIVCVGLLCQRGEIKFTAAQCSSDICTSWSFDKYSNDEGHRLWIMRSHCMVQNCETSSWKAPAQ